MLICRKRPSPREIARAGTTRCRVERGDNIVAGDDEKRKKTDRKQTHANVTITKLRGVYTGRLLN